MSRASAEARSPSLHAAFILFNSPRSFINLLALPIPVSVNQKGISVQACCFSRRTAPPLPFAQRQDRGQFFSSQGPIFFSSQDGQRSGIQPSPRYLTPNSLRSAFTGFHSRIFPQGPPAPSSPLTAARGPSAPSPPPPLSPAPPPHLPTPPPAFASPTNRVAPRRG